MAVTKKIRVEIETQVTKAIADFKKFEKQKNKNKKKVNEINSAFKRMAGTLAVAFGGQQIASFATEAVKTNAKIKTMERSFHALGRSIGTNDKSLDKLRGALNGTMTDTELMEQANNAMLLGIVESDDQMAELFDNAQRLSQALGKDARYGVESLTTGIGRQSKLMLDNLGIIVKTEDAYKAYAVQLGKNTSDLTDNERKQAFIEATMEAVRSKVAELGPEVLDLNQLFDANAVASEGLQKAVGEKLEPAFKAMLAQSIELKDEIAKFIKGLSEDSITKIKEFGTLILQTMGILVGFRSAVLLAKNANVLLSMSFNLLKKATGVLLVAGAVEVIRNNMDKITRKYKEFLLFVEKNRTLLSIVFPGLRAPQAPDQGRIKELEAEIQSITDKIKAVGGEGEDVDLGLIGDLKNLFVDNGDQITAVTTKIKEDIEDAVAGSGKIVESKTEENDLGKSILDAQSKTTESAFKALRARGDIIGSLKKIIANFILQITYLKVQERLEKRITNEKRKQVALSAVKGVFSPFATGGSFVNNTQKFDTGGSFVTNSRTILPTNPPTIVGDNASARELVEITPLPSPTKQGRQITININAPVVDEYVVDSIIPAIKRAEKLGL